MAADAARFLSQLKEGQAGAWQRFVTDSQPRLIRFFRAKRVGQATVEDLSQETYLTALLTIAKVRKPESLTSWLYGVARHVYCAHVRAELGPALPPPPKRRPLQLPSDVLETVEQLSASQRDVAHLRFDCGLTCRDIAGMLGTRESTIRAKLTQIKQRLLGASAG